MSIVWNYRDPVRREDKPADPKPGEPGYSFRERYERMCRELADENERRSPKHSATSHDAT